MDSSNFATSAGMFVLSSIICYLCFNGFVQKALDRQVDRVARFALGFFIIVSGILISRTNFLASALDIVPESLIVQSCIRVYICSGMLLCIQAMLSDARKRYWWGALFITLMATAAAYLAFPYL